MKNKYVFFSSIGLLVFYLLLIVGCSLITVNYGTNCNKQQYQGIEDHLDDHEEIKHE